MAISKCRVTLRAGTNLDGEAIRRLVFRVLAALALACCAGAFAAESVDLRDEIQRRGIEVRDQGKRPTCSVHAMVFLLEWFYTNGGRAQERKYNHLSVEYLNHMANVACNGNDDGDFFQNIHEGFVKYGIVPDSAFPYDKYRTYDFSKMTLPPSVIKQGQRLLKNGPPISGRFVKEWSNMNPGLTDAQFDEVLGLLRRGIPVALGRDHSTVAVGFTVDEAQPGGGFFVIRNSHGAQKDDHGYFTESFDSVKRTVFDVFVYEPR